jgi:hypothetical protein
MVLLAVVLLVSGTGATWAPEPAVQACRAWHTVRYGQTLSSIAAYYGVYWPYMAQVNDIRPPRYTVYAGTALCVPAGGTYPGGNTGGFPWYYSGGRTWSFTVAQVVRNTSVTIQTYGFPNNVAMDVRMGRWNGNAYDWVDLDDIDTGTGGSYQLTFNIPAGFANANQLVLRMVQTKKNGRVFSQDQVFFNTASGSTGGIPGPIYYPPYYYYGIPTIWIVDVERNSSVTIQTHNFPPGVTFDVLMGPIGSRGVGGYHVGTLNSGAGGSLSATFTIPAQLYNLDRIAIRTQNWPTGYHSYNWFYNNTTN